MDEVTKIELTSLFYSLAVRAEAATTCKMRKADISRSFSYWDGTIIRDNRVESPIEARLFAHILLIDLEYFFGIDLDRPDLDGWCCRLEMQKRIGPYFADFFFTLSRDENVNFLAVECDGHDFHERTKEQATHDKRRDRYFAKHGIPVLRFTGSEIWKDAAACALEIQEFLQNRFSSLADLKISA